MVNLYIMQDFILSPITREELKLDISETIKKELQTILATLHPQKEETELLSRKDAAKVLGVSLPTLNEWTKSGTVKGYRIASRIRYKRSELDSSLSQIRTRKIL
jgi:excisionase family DNA binding protein